MRLIGEFDDLSCKRRVPDSFVIRSRERHEEPGTTIFDMAFRTAAIAGSEDDS